MVMEIGQSKVSFQNKGVTPSVLEVAGDLINFASNCERTFSSVKLDLASHMAHFAW